ncbi:MAG: nucleoside deaminase [Actinobacteria bacterium]|nr:nucleoside deaminase [Actinomycetota bacterium]
MRLALGEAGKASGHGDVPVGAVVVSSKGMLSSAHNERELRGDPTAHAEILALREAAAVLGTWRLEAATMYVTLEPCVMCAGALVAARVARLVYGPQDARYGAAYSLYNVPQDPRLNHVVEISTGVLAEESRALLQSFFGARRV